MISVILYGRNDSYGYNLHKRGAISLNCLAAVLSDPDDEIIFVDYNTPNELPTFVEAIYDTLTAEARRRLRVLRVRPEVHKRLAGPTHLEALEPQARNIAIRRSHPRNPWILLTNTDMIFLARDGFRDLTNAVSGLAEGVYTIPRFELPEPLWESFPRSDPPEVLQACRDLGPQLHLDEVTHSLPESRYDQVGDFQLVPRHVLWEICGFDERMIHGWHCDSNMARRLYLYFDGRTESLADRLKGYHCDHTRVATGAHRMDGRVDNNVMEFVFKVDHPAANHQSETWGAPNVKIEEVDFVRDPQARFIEAVERTLGAPQESEYVASAIGIRNYLPVKAEHILPYLASDLSVFRPQARFAYAGNHRRMLDLASRCIAEMGFEAPLEYAAALLKTHEPLEIARPIDATDLPGALQGYDLVIFDLSLDAASINGKPVDRVTDWPRSSRYSLGAVARCLEAWAGCAGEGGARVPGVLVINANHHTFRDFVNQFLLLTFTPAATHVRKGRPRVGEERRSRSSNWKNTEDALISFFGYDVEDDSAPPITLGESIDFTSAGKPSRFKDGHWGATDYTGTWTDGDRAIFLFQPPNTMENLAVCLRVNQTFIGLGGEPIRIEVVLDGVRMARWSFFSPYEPIDAKVMLPAALLSGKQVCHLEFHVENPQSVELADRAKGKEVVYDDPRMLGCKIQRLAFRSAEDLRYTVGSVIEFTTAGQGADLVNECWSLPDQFGMWTLGARSTLMVLPSQPMESRAQATFTINDVAVSDEHPTQSVRVLLNGRQVAMWTLGPVRDAGKRTILLPAGALSSREPSIFAFQMDNPLSPVQLGWSTWDKRPLGFRLARLRIATAGRLKYRLGDKIDFMESGDALVFVGDAMDREWSLPGSRGSWTIGQGASFRVVFEEPVSRDLCCGFVISDCMLSPAAPTLGVTVKANGQDVAHWAIDHRRPHRQFVNIPSAVIASAPDLTITFEIAEPRSPESLAWSSDPRPLGFQLARVVIGGDVEIPKFKAVGRERPMYQRILGLPQYALHVSRILLRKYFRSSD